MAWNQQDATPYSATADFLGWNSNDVSPPSVTPAPRVFAPSLPDNTTLIQRNVVYWNPNRMKHVYVNDNNEWFEGDWARSIWTAWSVSASTLTATSEAPQLQKIQQILSKQYESQRQPLKLSQTAYTESSTTFTHSQDSSSTFQTSLSAASHAQSNLGPDLGNQIPLKLSARTTPLGTLEKRWKLDTINVQLSGGKYVTAGMGFGYKLDPGKTFRQVIVEQLLENTAQIPDIPETAFLSPYVGLVVNRCTGDATRMTIWELISSADAVDYIWSQNIIPEETRIEYKKIANKGVLPIQIAASERATLVVCMRVLLRMLISTGSYEDGRLVVWERFGEHGFSNGYCGVVIKPIWTTYMIDAPDSTCLTMLSGCCTIRRLGSNCRCSETPTMTLTTKLKIRVTQRCCKQAISEADKLSQKSQPIDHETLIYGTVLRMKPRKLKNGFLLRGNYGPYDTTVAPIKLRQNSIPEPVTLRVVEQEYFANNRHAISKPWAPDDPHQPLMYAFRNKCCYVIEAEMYTGGVRLDSDEYVLTVKILNTRYKPPKR
ncbi:hypothetical protein FB567DRAFT_246070 [Paraphoma chrysanthemicola]|uniref:Uncharacterized protein n=1 Tax=Paraphoma chrysanthemicola TaxID=798071 RepID=A0A8K0VSL1_9PLEO|nr:hypothetical protein FB567DRAFT_246070 [Paraphoma chrysanthemicola]